MTYTRTSSSTLVGWAYHCASSTHQALCTEIFNFISNYTIHCIASAWHHFMHSQLFGGKVFKLIIENMHEVKLSSITGYFVNSSNYSLFCDIRTLFAEYYFFITMNNQSIGDIMFAERYIYWFLMLLEFRWVLSTAWQLCWFL